MLIIIPDNTPDLQLVFEFVWNCYEHVTRVGVSHTMEDTAWGLLSTGARPFWENRDLIVLDYFLLFIFIMTVFGRSHRWTEGAPWDSQRP